MHFTFSEIKEEAKKYNGWDYCEVYKALSIEHTDDNDEAYFSILRNKINNCLKDLSWGGSISEDHKKVLLACRAYTWKIGHTDNHHTFKQPVWEGLSQVSDDFEFLRIFSCMFPYMWD